MCQNFDTGSLRPTLENKFPRLFAKQPLHNIGESTINVCGCVTREAADCLLKGLKLRTFLGCHLP